MYLLDTNIVSFAVRDPDGPLARRIVDLDRSEIGISVIVAAELRYGMEKRRAFGQLGRLRALLELLSVLSLEAGVDQLYARIRADLERRGTPIGGNDLFIAAHALALGATLVTDNVREFSRVPDLVVENWLLA